MRVGRRVLEGKFTISRNLAKAPLGLRSPLPIKVMGWGGRSRGQVRGRDSSVKGEELSNSVPTGS